MATGNEDVQVTVGPPTERTSLIKTRGRSVSLPTKLKDAGSASKGSTERSQDSEGSTDGSQQAGKAAEDQSDGLSKVRQIIYLILYFPTGQYVSPTPSKWKSRLTSVYFVVISLTVWWVINIFPFAITVIDWYRCNSPWNYHVYYDVCYSIVLHPTGNNHSDIPKIVLRAAVENLQDTNNNVSDLFLQRNELKLFTIYTKLVLLVTSFSSMTSYVFFFLAFTKLYFLEHLNKETWLLIRPVAWFFNKVSILLNYLYFGKTEEHDVKPLHPFNDDKPSVVQIDADDNQISTRFEWRQAISYYSFLLVNLAVNFAMLIVFIYGQYLVSSDLDESVLLHGSGQSPTKKLSIYEIVTVSAYFLSLICTVFSCFIFSKLAYGIQNKYKDFKIYFKHVNVPDHVIPATPVSLEEVEEETDPKSKNSDLATEHENFESCKKYVRKKHDVKGNELDLDQQDKFHIRLYYLQERDKHFTKVATKTIKVFELWFFFHWVLYIISSFLSLSLFFEAIIDQVQSSLPDKTNAAGDGINFQNLEIVFLGLFSVSNCLFFLYPCIRAASVTNSRQVQIGKLNEEYSRYQYITPELKEKFVAFLRSQNAGFDLHILCARVPFGFSVAYISIFIALFSVLLKVGTSI